MADIFVTNGMHVEADWSARPPDWEELVYFLNGERTASAIQGMCTCLAGLTLQVDHEGCKGPR